MGVRVRGLDLGFRLQVWGAGNQIEKKTESDMDSTPEVLDFGIWGQWRTTWKRKWKMTWKLDVTNRRWISRSRNMANLEQCRGTRIDPRPERGTEPVGG